MNMLMNINRERFNSFFEVFGGIKAAGFEDTALHQSILFQFIKQSTQGHLVLLVVKFWHCIVCTLLVILHAQLTIACSVGVLLGRSS